MTFRLTASEHLADVGWLEFGWIACNFCSARVPDTGSAELADLVMAELVGWTRFAPFDMCPECRSSMYQEASRD